MWARRALGFCYSREAVRSARGTVVITGASGFIGGAIAEALIDRWTIRSLTFHPAKNLFGERVSSVRYDFDHPERMAEAFAGADVFVNTYYVRFPHGGATFERAVDQTQVLLDCARRAGVRRIVHVSVSNAREDSELPYYRNKGRIERLVRESGLEHAILRPALVFGPGDILINNIAYFLRRAPVFGVFGRGDSRVQPVALDAFARLAVDAIEVEARDGAISLDVAGPADYTYRELVELVRAAVGSRAAIVSMPAWAAVLFAWAAGLVLRDVVLTRQEAEGLARGYLFTDQPVRAGKSLAAWLAEEDVCASLGTVYASELARHFR